MQNGREKGGYQILGGIRELFLLVILAQLVKSEGCRNLETGITALLVSKARIRLLTVQVGICFLTCLMKQNRFLLVPRKPATKLRTNPR